VLAGLYACEVAQAGGHAALRARGSHNAALSGCGPTLRHALGLWPYPSAGAVGLSPAASLRAEPVVTISEIEPAPPEDAAAAAARAAKGKAAARGVIGRVRPLGCSPMRPEPGCAL